MQMLGGAGPTPTQIKANERSKRFRADIARRAAEIAPEAELRRYVIEVQPISALPPIPNRDIAEAVEICFPSWVNEITRIQIAVCREWGVTRLDLLSERRTRNLVIPRQTGMFLARKMTRQSLPKIGRRFGGRDHTTALYAVNRIEQLMAHDVVMKARVYALAESLGGSLDG